MRSNGIEKQKDIYASLKECMQDGVLVVQKGIIEDHNVFFKKMSGYSTNEISGSRIENLLALSDLPDQRTGWECLKKENGSLGVFETSISHKTGDKIDVKINSLPIQFRGDAADLIIIRDISDQKKMEKELHNAHRLESIAALSGGIAHDYNNLLTAILGNISMALEHTDPDEPVSD